MCLQMHDEFALRRGQVYATILASRKPDVLEAWLRGPPGVQMVCRNARFPS
jgi:hypothetical protein